ncbi:MAG TPA: MBL fold metallo-hydrolase, partial [Dehalococcoidales bacterium]|nr:MBL fold metallo-hydrolase [Dehalococcoidales bacterium]
MQIKITFLGAAQNVTGSRYLIEANGFKFLVDCGLFQEHDLKVRDWAPFPVNPHSIDAVLLTHAHLDHCGYLPKLVKEGFNKKIYCTSATEDITSVMLMDAAHLQTQDAENKKKRHLRDGRRGPHPELPLYTVTDAQAAISHLTPVSYKQTVQLAKGISFTFYDAGHVLGAAMIEVKIEQNGEQRTLLFSGDIGRQNKPIINNPTVFDIADYVWTESTYGDRELDSPLAMYPDLIDIINSTVAAGGNIVIPSFALERSQDLLYYLSLALTANKIKPIQVLLDSPMAVDITNIFCKHMDLFDDDMKALLKAGKSPFSFAGLKCMTSVEDSKSINNIKEPSIIISGAGMCNGGRIKYHLIQNITRPESTILFVGYQAVETLGRHITDGAAEVRILGQNYPVKAKIVKLNGFSSHADKDELLGWISGLKRPPRQVFVVHGEESAALTYAETIRQSKGWKVTAPKYLEE